MAGLSGAARTARLSGGFEVTATDPILIGQVQVVDAGDPEHAVEALLMHKQDILNLANSLHPKMVARGGGAGTSKPSGTRRRKTPRHDRAAHPGGHARRHGREPRQRHVRRIATLVESITGGKVFLRIPFQSHGPRAGARERAHSPRRTCSSGTMTARRCGMASSSRTTWRWSTPIAPQRTTRAS